MKKFTIEKVESVLEKIFRNETFNLIEYPMLEEKFGRSGGGIFKDFKVKSLRSFIRKA